jgi:NAD(P)-dependent dehydrogenase (short-subunit alcohol dehydrogenase family)
VKTALITGAAGGIGTALCDAFREAGYRVIASDLRPGSEDDVFVEVDLDRFAVDKKYCTEKSAALRREMDGRLDVLVNNAAVQLLGIAQDITLEDWERSLRVNLTAPMLLTQALLKPLEAAQGCVINISSIHAKLTKPGFVTYATTKAALEGMTRAMAVDLGGRVRVNGIAPAAIRTKMLEAGFEGESNGVAKLVDFHPSRQLGEPFEVGALAVTVAEGGPFLTGSVFSIDGGVASRLHDPA